MIAKSKRRELYSTATYVPLRGIPLDYRRPSWAFIIKPAIKPYCVLSLSCLVQVRKLSVSLSLSLFRSGYRDKFETIKKFED